MILASFFSGVEFGGFSPIFCLWTLLVLMVLGANIVAHDTPQK
jgi:hypothetical protein